MTFLEKLLNITRQLLPTGRAFWIPVGSWKEKLAKARLKSRERFYNDAVSTFNAIIPDNDNFTEDDAKQWYRRLGLIYTEAVPLATKKAAILRKMNHPGTVPAREARSFIQKQLRDAGFDVYVYENIFDDGMGGTMTRTPEDVTGVTPQAVQYGDAQYGDFQYGTGMWELIVNYLDRDLDGVFNVGGNLRFTFFIGGPYLGDYANIPENRREEFRQMVLRAKPQNMAAYPFVNYI